MILTKAAAPTWPARKSAIRFLLPRSTSRVMLVSLRMATDRQRGDVSWAGVAFHTLARSTPSGLLLVTVKRRQIEGGLWSGLLRAGQMPSLQVQPTGAACRCALSKAFRTSLAWRC